MTERERERERGGEIIQAGERHREAERERERERIPSRLCTTSTEPYMGL